MFEAVRDTREQIYNRVDRPLHYISQKIFSLEYLSCKFSVFVAFAKSRLLLSNVIILKQVPV